MASKAARLTLRIASTRASTPIIDHCKEMLFFAAPASPRGWLTTAESRQVVDLVATILENTKPQRPQSYSPNLPAQTQEGIYACIDALRQSGDQLLNLRVALSCSDDSASSSKIVQSYFVHHKIQQQAGPEIRESTGSFRPAAADSRGHPCLFRRASSS
jgi:hypothetical protein